MTQKRQQVNLYQPVSRREHKTFGGTMVAGALAILVVALAAFSVYATRSVEVLESEVARLTEAQVQQQAQMAQAGDLNAQGSQPVDLQALVKSLTATLNERTQALHVLQSGAAGQTTGFASRLEALARRHVEGLWIDALALSGTRNTMRLSGGSVDAAIVPSYLRGLSSEPALTGTRFDDFVIDRPKKGDAAEVRFHVGSTSLPARQTPDT
jgi:hypothetical protein